MRTSINSALSAALTGFMLLSAQSAFSAKPDPDDPASIRGRNAPSAYDWSNKKTSNDKDADGIPDSIEEKPLNFGSVSITLKPDRKDVIILMDSVGADNSNKPTEEALAIFFKAFNAAPVKGLRGQTGIALHLITINPGALLDSKTNIGKFVNNEYDWSDLDFVKQYTIKTYNLQNVPSVYHYCLSCYSYGGTDSSGISRNKGATYAGFRTGGIDFICSLSGSQSNIQYAGMTGGTIMHEFGHNLGLTHGGYDHLNFKPNYISIMNYHFQFNGIMRSNGKAGIYDYSSVLLNPIDERKVNEKAGLGPKSSGLGTKVSYPGLIDPVTITITGDIRRNIDWNCNGFIDNKSYERNLNYPFDQDATWLVSEDNWENVNFTGGGQLKASSHELLPVAALGGSGDAALTGIPRPPNYKNRFTKAPDHLRCREVTESDKAAIEASPDRLSVEKILGPDMKLIKTTAGDLTLYELSCE